MFGRLPKPVTAAAVQVCSNSTTPLSVPQARVIQQVRAISGGYTILPKDAAIMVVAAAQGGSALKTALRIGAGITEIAAIAAGWSGLSVTIKGTLTATALSGSAGINVLASAIPTHTLLTIASEMLHDPLMLPSLGCESGYALVEADKASDTIDFSMQVPTVQQ